MRVCDPAVQHDLLEAAGHIYCWKCGENFKGARQEKEWTEAYYRNKKKKLKIRNLWKTEPQDQVRVFSTFHIWIDKTYGWGFTILNFAFSYE